MPLDLLDETTRLDLAQRTVVPNIFRPRFRGLRIGLDHGIQEEFYSLEIHIWHGGKRGDVVIIGNLKGLGIADSQMALDL